MENAISFDSVGKSFSHLGAHVTAIKDLTFTVKKGEYLCVLGRSGCGKSTMINLLLGLQHPDKGKAAVFGHQPYADFNALKGRIGCIFQSDRLLPWRSAIDNILLPREILGTLDDDARSLARQLLHRFGLQGFEKARPSQLSGGMRQRVAVARAMISDPDVLLADEAFGHLDEATGEQLRKDFRNEAKAAGKTVLHVTHSINEAIEISDRIIVLGRPGRVIENITLKSDANRDQVRMRLRASLNSDAR